MNKWIVTYTVTGFGQFPIDMLRYDRSFPYTESESGKIAGTFHRAEPWSVKLAMYSDSKAVTPCEGRWKSFNCRISNIEAAKL